MAHSALYTLNLPGIATSAVKFRPAGTEKRTPKARRRDEPRRRARPDRRFAVAVAVVSAQVCPCNTLPARVVNVDDAGAAHAEQQAFAGHVLRHVPVLHAADVILGKVRKKAEVEREARHAAVAQAD